MQNLTSRRPPARPRNFGLTLVDHPEFDTQDRDPRFAAGQWLGLVLAAVMILSGAVVLVCAWQFA